MVTIPPFSSPKTRSDYDRIILQLTESFTKQGFSDARTLAAMTVNLRDQGLSDSQILKQIDTHLANSKARADAKAAEVAKLQAQQQPLLDKLAAEKAAKQKIIDAQNAEREAALKEFIHGKPSNEMLADPRDPSKKVTRAEYDRIIAERQAQGKDTTNKTGNPETEKIRAQIAAEKAKTLNPVVVAVNRSYVQLSNGQLIERSKFTGTIPAELLANEKTTEQFPKSFNSQTDAPTATTAPTAKPNTTAKTTVDPVKSKQGTGKFGDNSAFSQPAPKPEETLGGALQSAADALTGALSGKTTEEVKAEREAEKTNPKKEESAPFDPLKTLADFFGSATKTISDTVANAQKTISDSVAAVTNPPSKPAEKPTEVKPQPEPRPTATTPPEPTATEPKPEPTVGEKSTGDKIKEFAEKHATAIVVSVAAVGFLTSLAFTIKPARQAVMRRQN